MANPPQDEAARLENFAFLKIGRHLRSKGIPVPAIHLFDLDQGFFLMADLGTVNLQEAVAASRSPLSLYKRVVELLFRLQIEGADGLDPTWSCQSTTYDRFVMRRFESDYFTDAFLRRYVGLDKTWSELQAPYEYLADMASEAEPRFFMHRDFQSRNIMVKEGQIGIVDWQGGRMGPLGYDLASLIIDPYTNLSSQLRRQIFKDYLGLIEAHAPQWKEAFVRTFPYLLIQRNLQILGAFAFLTKSRRRTHFEPYIPIGLNTLAEQLRRLDDPKLRPLSAVVASVKRVA
jgi:aminoglycoside/choline kinase family phosphotransferase